MLLTAFASRVPAQSRRQTGLSLVEMMVAVVIGLLGMVVLFQVAKLVEGQRRTTTSGSDAQANGGFALYTLQGDLRQAGYGLNWASLLACTAVQAHDTDRGDLASFAIAPVIITEGTGTASDTITTLSGSSPFSVAPVVLTTNMLDATADLKVGTRFAFRLNDIILLTETGKPCTLAQVSGLPTTPADVIEHTTGRYNKPGGFTDATYTTNGAVFTLGQSPTRNIYSIVNRNLVVENTLDSTTQRIVAPQIVQLKARYGKDTDGDGVVDSYNNVTPTKVDDWRQVATLQLALVARSAQPERPSGSTPTDCDTTPTAPTWSGGTFNLSADSNWKCYRYRVFETNVALRNQIWFQN